MSPRRLTWLVACLSMAYAPLAGALEFRSVKESGAVLYEAPALSAKKLFVVSRYYPVEVLSTQDAWARVRDATGAISWLPSAALSAQRWLLVVSERADVRTTPTAAGVAFSVPKNGVLQLMDPPSNGWVHVRHRDGSTGYASITDLWGL
ncbi:SH3 domain-containing protein [Paludibacterium purpuratum]|uniref:SH3 domain-containing protein n=1 Tax=Paludibacterium purpuratum TaxID=1144873 RepID=A0A4R7AZ25_9NEIS|nr:SH3 domain-containing protein [Paludibacterium purpuratum]TDR73506.1 SH3 domain-containing protein [Paludibacterium purpuratum]